jgi:prevent-host-death family protein
MVLSATVVAGDAKSVPDVAGDDRPNYYDHVREIGIGELRMRLGSVIKRVEQGERVRVTRRGRYVADLLPPETDPAEMRMRKLIAEGKVTPPSAPLDRNPPPPRKTGGSASAIILAEREEDR